MPPPEQSRGREQSERTQASPAAERVGRVKSAIEAQLKEGGWTVAIKDKTIYVHKIISPNHYLLAKNGVKVLPPGGDWPSGWSSLSTVPANHRQELQEKARKIQQFQELLDTPSRPRPIPTGSGDPLRRQTTQPQRQSVQPQRQPERREQVRSDPNKYSSREAFVNGLKAEVRVNGTEVNMESLNSYFNKNRTEVPKSRYQIFERNFKDAAGNLERTFGNYSIGQILSLKADGPRIIAEVNDGKFIATSTNVLWQPKDSSSYYKVPEDGGKIIETKNKMRRADTAAKDVYKYNGYTDYHRRDGSLQNRIYSPSSSITNIRHYNGSDNLRPSIIYLQSLGRDGSATARFARRNGSKEMVEHTFNKKGLYVLGPEGGEPMGKYRPSRSNMNEADRTSEIREFAQKVARNLKTPEAIGAYVSTIFSREYKYRDSSNRTVRWTADRGGQQVQHPYKTLELGAGDCEDFALLAKELLRLAGIESVVMLQSRVHYICAFLEKHPDGYKLCYIDTGGFKRVAKTFASPAEAMKHPWSGSKGSGAQWLLDKHPGYEKAYTPEVKKNGGVIELRTPKSIDDTKESFSTPMSFQEYDWSRITVER